MEVYTEYAVKKICQTCFCIIEDVVGHAVWCDSVLDELKEMFGLDTNQK